MMLLFGSVMPRLRNRYRTKVEGPSHSILFPLGQQIPLQRMEFHY